MPRILCKVCAEIKKTMPCLLQANTTQSLERHGRIKSCMKRECNFFFFLCFQLFVNFYSWTLSLSFLSCSLFKAHFTSQFIRLHSFTFHVILCMKEAWQFLDFFSYYKPCCLLLFSSSLTSWYPDTKDNRPTDTCRIISYMHAILYTKVQRVFFCIHSQSYKTEKCIHIHTYLRKTDSSELQFSFYDTFCVQCYVLLCWSLSTKKLEGHESYFCRNKHRHSKRRYASTRGW